MLRNPYTPGAGYPPKFLAGRDATISDIIDRIFNTLSGGMPRHTILYGVRGVGKTVLLNKVESLVEDNDSIIAEHIECITTRNFPKDICAIAQKTINRLSALEASKTLIKQVIGFLKAFNLSYNPSDSTFSFGFDGDIAVGNISGNFDLDMCDLLINVGKLVKANHMCICLFIDEIQSLDKHSLSALVGAIHRANQLQLPIIIIGAGLPTILRISSEARSYSERLFNFVEVGSLKNGAERDALVNPALEKNITYDEDAITFVSEQTGGYPYFIQEFGSAAWAYIKDGHISYESILQAYDDYQNVLDESFFSARYNRTTTKEKEFLFAMAKCTKFPCAMSQVAINMAKAQNSISQFRNNLINKGLVYSPAYGEVDFTVPQFDLFLKRVTLK